MNSIPVKPYPLERSYATWDKAIQDAIDHPLQAQAQADGQSLSSTYLIDGYWTSCDFVLRFSNEIHLHTFVQNGLVRWMLSLSPPNLNGIEVERVGAPAIVLDWGGAVGESPMDRSAMLVKRRGAEFSRLWVNEGGLLVYLRRQPILWFHAIYRTDTREDMLFVTEEE
jgi:hypothetical protein